MVMSCNTGKSFTSAIMTIRLISPGCIPISEPGVPENERKNKIFIPVSLLEILLHNKITIMLK